MAFCSQQPNMTNKNNNKKRQMKTRRERNKGISAQLKCVKAERQTFFCCCSFVVVFISWSPEQHTCSVLAQEKHLLLPPPPPLRLSRNLLSYFHIEFACIQPQRNSQGVCSKMAWTMPNLFSIFPGHPGRMYSTKLVLSKLLEMLKVRSPF